LVESRCEIPKEAANLAKDDMFTILNYIVMQAQVPDLGSQLMFMREFSSEYIQSGDGSAVSVNFQDLMSCVLYMSNIEAAQLKEKA
jgi:hypothetical protein